MSKIEETLERHRFKKHVVYTKRDPRGPEYGRTDIEVSQTGDEVKVFVRPSQSDWYRLVFPSFLDFRRWLEHKL